MQTFGVGGKLLEGVERLPDSAARVAQVVFLGHGEHELDVSESGFAGVLHALLVESQGEGGDAVLFKIRAHSPEDLARVAHLRDVLGIHERRDLHLARAAVDHLFDVLDLGFRRDGNGMVLPAVAGSDLGDQDFFRQRHDLHLLSS